MLLNRIDDKERQSFALSVTDDLDAGNLDIYLILKQFYKNCRNF